MFQFTDLKLQTMSQLLVGFLAVIIIILFMEIYISNRTYDKYKKLYCISVILTIINILCLGLEAIMEYGDFPVMILNITLLGGQSTWLMVIFPFTFAFQFLLLIIVFILNKKEVPKQ